MRRRIAIACQGGGSQCAFVAGALKALFAQGLPYRYRITGLSGTSGGALTAAVAWYGLLKQAKGDRTPVEDRIVACWQDLSAQTPFEVMFDRFGVAMLRLAERGVLPTVALSPSSVRFRIWADAMSSVIGRPEFTDLRALLDKHIQFDALPELMQAESPVLLVGASDVMEGNFRIFSSAHHEIRVEALLASAAIPNLFPAVQVDGHAYWDGIFASNPPLVAFLRESLTGRNVLPEEIWVIQVNPSSHDYVPELPAEIFSRRNHLAGNLSMRHELETISILNLLLQQGALTEEFRARFGLQTASSIAVRFIRMSSEVQRELDYPSKLSRNPKQIARLIADGEAQAMAFLATLGDPEKGAWKTSGRAEVSTTS